MMLLLKIALVAILLTWLACIIIAYGYGTLGVRLMRHECPREERPADTPPLSVIIPAHNQAAALRRHLPEILEQDYERFEVIVIDMQSQDETRDVLERLELQYAYLHHTSVPASARDISIERLALTLGFRAALHEWVVVTQPDCHPASSLWLRRMGEFIQQPQRGPQSPRLKTPDMVLGFARYDERRSTWLDYQTGFLRLSFATANFRHILGGHAAVTADGCNIAFRKSVFMEQGGFGADHNLKKGAVELLVNHTSTPSNTALLMAPAAQVIQDRLSAPEQWKQQRVYAAETRTHQHHATRYRLAQGIRLLAPWLILFTLFLLLIALFPLILLPQMDGLPLSDILDGLGIDVPVLWILAGVLAVLLIAYVATFLVRFNKTTRALACRSYYSTLLLFTLALPFWLWSDRLSRRLAARNEFRKNFV